MRCRGARLRSADKPGSPILTFLCKESATTFWRVERKYYTQKYYYLQEYFVPKESARSYVTALCAYCCDSAQRHTDNELWISISEAEAEQELAIMDVHSS